MSAQRPGLCELVILIGTGAVWGAALLPGFLRERGERVAVEALLEDGGTLRVADLLRREAWRSGKILLVGRELEDAKIRLVRSDVPLEGEVLRQVLLLNDVVREEKTVGDVQCTVAHGRRTLWTRAPPPDPDFPRFAARDPFVTAVVQAGGDRGTDIFAALRGTGHLTAHSVETGSAVYVRDRAIIIVDHAPRVARDLRRIDASRDP